MGCGSSATKDRKCCLPQDDCDCTARSKNVEAVRGQYNWKEWPERGLPPSADGIPEPESEDKYNGGTTKMSHAVRLFTDLKGKAARMNFMEPANLLAGVFIDEGPFEDYRLIYPTNLTFEGLKRNMPAVESCWREDREFGQQRLNGVNPLTITRYTGPMANFPVTDALLEGVLPAGQTLESLTEAKRLYVCDYKAIHGIRAPAENNFVAPIALFLVADDKELMPVAIQLGQEGGDAEPVFTPKVDTGLWLLVKWFVQAADACLHENISHLLTTHMIPETVYVACRRNLAPNHPLMEFVATHFWFTIHINHSARTTLMDPEIGELPSLFAMGYEGMCDMVRRYNDAWDWEDYDPEKDAKKRGVDDADALPGYYYRDDQLKLWKLLKKYTGDVVDAIYPTDEDLLKDNELASMGAELVSKVTWRNLPISGQGKFKSKKHLQYFLCLLLNTVSPRHNAVNNGQFDYLGFIPNMPPKLRTPPPTSTALTFTEPQLAGFLPTYKDAVIQITFFETVSTPAEKEELLGQVPKGWLVGIPGADDAVAALQTSLDAVAKEIDARNEGLRVPYTYLHPNQLSLGVAV